jgi:signal transduction histidine kinase
LANGRYYSGSWYDVPLVAAISWMAATALTARQWPLEAAPSKPEVEQRALTPRLAMLAILSLPALGLWTFLFDRSPEESRIFRLFTVLAAMVVLGAFVFLRQYLQDQALMRLLDESRSGYENQERLQSHLVQKEKLASLGHLVAGAAHEIDHPLTAIMTYSEQLWSNQRLTGEQDALVRKIVHQARRTRDLVSDLLSFAQESPAEKTLVDVAMLVQRSVLMLELQRRAVGIRAETFIDPELPLVWGNANQLFQAFVQMVENAVDALDETGGGSLHIIAQRQNREVVVQFSDTGPGIREPRRVFDPFYTTKPIGKGTGLGLSAVYGVIQDHKGQITCQNKPEGGALFVLRLPMATDAAVKAAAAKA